MKTATHYYGRQGSGRATRTHALKPEAPVPETLCHVLLPPNNRTHATYWTMDEYPEVDCQSCLRKLSFPTNNFKK